MASPRERAVVEDLALALVREYLAKRKYKKTLETLGGELAVKPVPTTTTALAKALGISKFVSRNAKAETPYPTLLDIFAEYMYTNFGKNDGSTDAAAPTMSSSSGSSSRSSAVSLERSSTSSSRSGNGSRRTGSLTMDDEEDLSRQLDRSSLAASSPTAAQSSAAATRTGFASSTSSNNTSGGGLRSPPSPSSYASPIVSSSKLGSTPSGSSAAFGSPSSASANARPGSASRVGRPSSSSSSSSSSSIRPQPPPSDLVLEDEVDFDEEVSSYDARKGAGGASGGRTAYGGAGSSSGGSSGGGGVLPFTPVPSSTPLSLEACARAKALIFGSSHLTGTFTDPWLAQGFFFQSADVCSQVPSLTCGLVQTQGGPCGMLAVVQAYLIKELLFGTNVAPNLSSSKRHALLAPSKDVLHLALVHALADILWLVGDQRLARCCTKNPSAARISGARKVGGATFKPDGVTEALQVVELTSLAAVRNFFAANLSTFMAAQGCGVVLFLYSVILTRGVDNIEQDRDEASSLIGAHSCQ
jgi:hypothetical protein